MTSDTRCKNNSFLNVQICRSGRLCFSRLKKKKKHPLHNCYFVQYYFAAAVGSDDIDSIEITDFPV